MASSVEKCLEGVGFVFVDLGTLVVLFEETGYSVGAFQRSKLIPLL